MRQAVLVLIAGVVFIGNTSAQERETLADVLQQHEIPSPPASIPHLTSRITSYDVLNDDREFLIAYYMVDTADENALRPPLFLTRFDKKTQEWQHVAITGQKSEGLPDRPELQDDCLGSVLRAEHHNSWYYLNLHWNPSAGCLLILNEDLSVSHTLPGGSAGFFQTGLLVYSGNMVHFADVHPETLWLYDPATHKSEQLYPQKNDPLRGAFSTRLEKVIDEKRCMHNNWGCDPDRFTSDLVYPIEVNDQTQSLAFHVRFEPEGFLPREEAEDSGQWDDDDYVYIYRLSPLRWRGFSIYDLKPKFGTDSLSELLTPAKLKQVFATPAP
ncbi:MAG TPA: hypothetical protein VEG30_18145 [Terriglobales bacterium]|nr:hypothetical protein [Terriglobales bacterium]